MDIQQLVAHIEGNVASALSGWASLWADLLHVDMTLLARQGMPINAAHLVARRALWEAAVVSYGRTAMSGRRQQRLTELIATEGPEAARTHQDIMAWRNQHVAHRVDERRETVDVGAIVDPVERRVTRINIRVAPVLGPEDEPHDLVKRFETHVKSLRDRIWEVHFRSLEEQALATNADRIDHLLAVAQPLTVATGFAIDIDPSGRT